VIHVIPDQPMSAYRHGRARTSSMILWDNHPFAIYVMLLLVVGTVYLGGAAWVVRNATGLAPPQAATRGSMAGAPAQPARPQGQATTPARLTVGRAAASPRKPVRRR
jgi:hypothetical protein